MSFIYFIMEKLFNIRNSTLDRTQNDQKLPDLAWLPGFLVGGGEEGEGASSYGSDVSHASPIVTF